MDYFLELLIGGLTRGSIYALIALGYTMVYGIIELINFAHGEIYMIGAFTALIVASVLTMNGMTGRVGPDPRLRRGRPLRLRLRLHRREDRLQTPAHGAAPLAADQRHRHVDLPAELRPHRPDFRLSALSEPAASPPLPRQVRAHHRIDGAHHRSDDRRGDGQR